jgi:hypothetical protein
MIVVSRYLRTWNTSECRHEGAVCLTPPDLGVLPGDGPLGDQGEMVSAPHRLLCREALGAHCHLGARCLAPPGRDWEA